MFARIFIITKPIYDDLIVHPCLGGLHCTYYKNPDALPLGLLY